MTLGSPRLKVSAAAESALEQQLQSQLHGGTCWQERRQNEDNLYLVLQHNYWQHHDRLLWTPPYCCCQKIFASRHCLCFMLKKTSLLQTWRTFPAHPFHSFLCAHISPLQEYLLFWHQLASRARRHLTAFHQWQTAQPSHLVPILWNTTLYLKQMTTSSAFRT